MNKITLLLVFLYLSSVMYSQKRVNLMNVFKESTTRSTLTLSADSIKRVASNLVESEYTVPTWTLLRKALTTADATSDSVSVGSLQLAMNNLEQKIMPYNVVMTLNGDPTSRMGFAWFTNQSVPQGKVQLVLGKDATSAKFLTPVFSFDADTTNFITNYCVSVNSLSTAAGFADNSKRTYTSHKALASGLQANTTYSFRVGMDGAWSDIGYFTTAKSTKDAFSFIYFTDPQAENDSMVGVCQRTMHIAKSMYPNASFALTCGDLAETAGTNNSEWEYEQFFTSQQDIWNTTPLVPIMGNHDFSSNQNFTKHFNTMVTPFDKSMATVPGSVYSFVYGDVLFLALNYEDYPRTAYRINLKEWLIQQVAANPTVKWKVAFCHRNMYTGGGHQPEPDITFIRNYFAPVFDSLKIDLVLQGHDHVYEVIGPLKGNALVPNSVTNQTISSPNSWDNLTGRSGGNFNVQQGTLYFLNSSSGTKEYAPSTQATMIQNASLTGIPDYFSLFSGRFGQPNRPTFSILKVNSDSINIQTYMISSKGGVYLFDKINVIKTPDISTNYKDELLERGLISISPNPAKTEISLNGLKLVDRMDLYDLDGIKIASVENVNQMNVTMLQNGIYILRVKLADKLLAGKVIISR